MEMDIREIMNVLPHRPPFLLIDKSSPAFQEKR